jgi:hypothetical protein
MKSAKNSLKRSTVCWAVVYNCWLNWNLRVMDVCRVVRFEKKICYKNAIKSKNREPPTFFTPSSKYPLKNNISLLAGVTTTVHLFN